jgi:hypothetical protein
LLINMRRKICIYKCMLNVYKRFWIHPSPTSCLPTLLIFIHIEHICSYFVAFFSATIDGRNLIFAHKLHIGTPYRGKRFLTRQIPTSWSRNPMDSKTLPTIWGTYMKLVTKYQISAINSCWEKCDEIYIGQMDRGKTVYPPSRDSS